MTSSIVVLALSGCSVGSAPTANELVASRDEAAPSPAAAAPPMQAGEGSLAKDVAERKSAPRGAPRAKKAEAVVDAPAEPEVAADDGEAKGGDGGEQRTRSWFPEAFLWRPLVETGDDGVAQVDLTVPDQLTTWRVLALAADASGQQTGAVHTFDSTLPVYVDPVVPGWLYAGDRLALPVQAVNTTQDALTASLSLTASGALDGTGVAGVTLSAGGSDVKTLPVRASGAGEARVLAKLSAGARSDAAERTIPVEPTGRPVEHTHGGTLTDRREITLTGPEQADPSTEEVEVVVFAGPLAVLQAEIARVSGGVRPDDGAYGFALAGWLDELSTKAGAKVDADLTRKLRVLAWQRVVRELRAPEPSEAGDLLASMRDVDAHEQAREAKPNLVRAAVQGQRADGTWARRPTSTVQELVVNTAAVARALPPDEQSARLRASGAVERFLHEVKDPYTAAVVLASGLLDDDASEPLRKLLKGAIVPDADGVPSIAVPAQAVDPWGIRPSHAEVLAWTVLALPKDDPARGDLAAQLMQGWDARWGFGAGRADAIALEAVASALPGAPSAVDVTLTAGEGSVAKGRVDPTQPKLPVVLTVHPRATSASFLGEGGALLLAGSPSDGEPRGDQGPLVLTASPAVPGLAFVATRRSWVPWTDDDRLPGVDVTVSASPLRVGIEGAVTVELAAPSGTSVHVEQGLPAGAVVAPDLAARNPRLTNVRILQDRVVFDTAPLGAGEILDVPIPVTPAFAGTFSTAPLLVGAQGREVPMKPLTWTVAGPGGA